MSTEGIEWDPDENDDDDMTNRPWSGFEPPSSSDSDDDDVCEVCDGSGICPWCQGDDDFCGHCLGAGLCHLCEGTGTIEYGAASEPAVDLGPCCRCGSTHQVRTLIALPRRAPVPGTGWSCVQCGLPADGAQAVLCDWCWDETRSAGMLDVAVCVGYPKEGKRMPADQLGPESFDHDLSKHPELGLGPVIHSDPR